MKLNEAQYQAARKALVENTVLDNFRIWEEDGQLSEEEFRRLIEEIFNPVEDK